MRHNRNSFYRELKPLAEKLAEIRETTPPMPLTCKDVPALMAKQAAKLARRTARAGHTVIK